MRRALLDAAVGAGERIPQRVLDVAAAGLGWGIVTADTSGSRQLAANLARIMGRQPTRRELAQAMASYMRYFTQAFTLGACGPDVIDARLRVEAGGDAVRAALEHGPVAIALTHAGNWDLAGTWAARQFGDVITVAEHVKPEELFDLFMETRARLGMDILATRKGEHVFSQLVTRCEGRTAIVPLLADRDITGRGIEVTLCGHRALVAAGPAALAKRLGGPLGPTFVREERLRGARASAAGTTWGFAVAFGDLIEVDDVEAATQQWVTAMEPSFERYPLSWHMLQPVFLDDLDPERLARARARVRKEDAE